MRMSKKALTDMIDETSTNLAEALDDPKRQILESFGRRGAERWTLYQVQFSEAARVAARRALWFLRLVEVDSDEPLRAHAQSKALHQLQTVAVPRGSQICQPGDPDSKCGYTGSIEPKCETLISKWDNLVARLSSQSVLSRGELRDIEMALEKFIKRSRPLDPFIRFTYALTPAVRSFLAQHFALIATLLTTLVVCAGVEAVRSLLLNEPRFTLLVFAAALTPLLILGAMQKALHMRGSSASWNLGGRVVHALPASLEPERWIPWHPEGYVRRVYLSLLLKMGMHVLLWIVMGLLVQAAIVALGVDGVWLTVYLVVMLCALVVLFGGAIDFADMHSQAPLRGLVLAGALVVFATILLSDSPAAAPVVIVTWLGLMVWWAWRVRNQRVLAVPGLILVVSMIGIGFTTSRRSDDVWRPNGPSGPTVQPADWPRGDQSSGPVVVLAASGGGSRAAIFTAKTLASLDASFPAIAENLQAISSVSGGSLANAAYISRRLRASNIVSDSGCGVSLSDAMSRDFLQPTLLGLVRPGGRGVAIQREWENCPVGLRGLSIDSLARLWLASAARNESKAPFPLPLFNSVSLERNAVVISPLDQAFFSSAFDGEARSDSNAYKRYTAPTWVYYRSGIYHINDLSDSMDASLSAAVRASANFPFGFPLVEVETNKPLWYSTRMSDTLARDTTTRIVRLTDGGALSNSGMWPLVPLLMNQRERIGDNRGVLMIVVDASRMPGAPWTDRQRGLVGTILDKNPKGERLHFQMLDQLEAEYGGCFGYVYIGIEPTPRYNVYTTWALDRGSLQLMDSAFAESWVTAKMDLRREYQRLQSCENGAAYDLRGKVRRVPLS